MPEGYWTNVDGIHAHVLGDTEVDQEGQEAIAAVIKAAHQKLKEIEAELDKPTVRCLKPTRSIGIISEAGSGMEPLYASMYQRRRDLEAQEASETTQQALGGPLT